MKFVAYVTKGLEFLSEDEIKSKVSDAQIIELGDKRISFDTKKDFKKLTELKTIDDIGLLVSHLEDITSLQSIISIIEKIDLNQFKNALSKYRDIDINSFSITTSFAGVKIFRGQELVKVISKKIEEKYNWTFTENNHSNFDIRFFIDGTSGYISVRLTENSLQHREYKTDSKKGSLKSTIAASMVYLATGGKSNLKIVDNFCGSGSILTEALLIGNEVYGGDIDLESVTITQRNLSNLGYLSDDKIRQQNASSTKWQSNYFDCVISNLPWNKQIKIKSIMQLYEGTVREYVRILKPNGVLCALVSNPELFVKYIKKYKEDAETSTFKIGLLGQNPTIVLAK